MQMANTKEDIIREYVRAYNDFDIEAMLKNLHAEIEFINISNGEIDLRLIGIDQFRVQAEKAKSIFSKRHQEITSISARQDSLDVEIDYRGTFAIDLSDQIKKGDDIELKGKSVFKFKDEKIIQLTDMS